MRKIFMIILPVVFTILCCKQKDSFLNEANFMTKDTLITLIFKDRTFKTDTIRYKNGIYGFKTQNLIYSIDGSFLEYPLPKNNYKKNDTIKIVSKKDIILYHGYYYNLYSLYKFKPGDIVEFNYQNDYPICIVKNRKLTNIDLNFLTELNVKIKKIKSESEFFIENNRFRTSIENMEAAKQMVELVKLKEVKLDSLKNTMNVDFYNINKKDIKNSLTSENQMLLTTNIDLSIPSGRDLVFKTYYAKHKPIILKKKNGSIYDSRLQIEKLVKEKNISTKNKDLLLYSFMSDLITNFSNQDIKKYFEVFKNNCSDKTLIKTLNDVYLININLDNINKNEVYLVDNNKNKHCCPIKVNKKRSHKMASQLKS
jgi:hypothetical protein